MPTAVERSQKRTDVNTGRVLGTCTFTQMGRQLAHVRDVGPAGMDRKIALGPKMQIEGTNGPLERHATSAPTFSTQGARSSSARREVRSCFSRFGGLCGSPSSGGKSPKFTFIG